ncbi:MAG: sugar kinase [Acidobacteria bacterium]|nr:sugar kinase [Acidobacteriota bacterium]
MISISGGILCAGNLTEDILVWPVDSVVYDATTWVHDIVTSFGGNGANTSYAIAKLGASVRFVGLVGNDEAGDRILNELRAAAIDLRVDRCDLPTPATVVVVRSDGARAFLHRPGASRESFADPLQFTADLIQGCGHFHLANPFAMPKMRPRAGETLRRAKESGLTTSLDTGWDSLGEWLDVIGPCLPHLDVLFANEAEAAKLSGAGDPSESAAFFLERGARSVVLKLGRQGCAVFDAGAQLRAPGFTIKAVDSTGAGDCFAGAFLAGLSRGLSVPETARLANAVGALCVERAGATVGLLDYESTVRWMGRQ